MPRLSSTASLDEIVKNAVNPIIERASGTIARTLATMVADQLDAELTRTLNGEGRRRGRRPVARQRARGEISKWVADRRARRVPNFVIEATGLKMKKAIVAKFGENATFEKGKPLPKVK